VASPEPNSPAGISSYPWVLGIVVALPEELDTLTRQKATQGECLALNATVIVAYSGAGPANAEKAANLLISQGANCLISWGCAAALSPQLQPGDLLIPDQVLSAQQQRFSIDLHWRQYLQTQLPARLTINGGCLIESPKIVADSLEKQQIHNRTGAAALDMESAGVIRAAQNAGLTALVIRVIADPASMDLPQAVVQSLNSNGQVEMKKLLRFLLGHPWEIPALIKLGLHFQAAQKTLKTVAKHLDKFVSYIPQG
jgi:adenosylhomocysteine nucleosidase